MASDAVLIAGVRLSSGRKPVTFAALNDRPEIVILAEWEVSEVINCIMEYEHVVLAIHFPTTKAGREVSHGFLEKISEAGFKHFSTKDNPRLWIESNADRCFGVYQSNLFPSRTLEGRLQRGLILYEEGVQIEDPMDFFEEITRHKLLQGVLPTENIYSSRQLDALIMAYVAWLAGNPAEKVIVRNQFMLPKITEND
jgi:hypothetical protein